jgi:hypothetical protein
VFRSIILRLFGCSHRRLTRPITLGRKLGVSSGEMSVACLDCGRQFAYDWNQMRIGKEIDAARDSGALHPDTPGSTKSK